MYCIYHKDDLDGICSAAIINKYAKDKNPEVDFIGLSYNQLKDFDISSLDNNRKVIVVDFSLKEEDMRSLTEENRLIWIDHHISAIEKLKDINPPGIRAVTHAACYLTWNYFFSDIKNLPPLSVKLLEEYDRWFHEDPRTLPFQYGMRLKNLNYNSKIWDVLLENDNKEYFSLIENLLEAGDTILTYQTNEYENYCKEAAFEAILPTFEKDYKVLAINRLFAGSKLFDSKWDPDKYDCMVAFGWRGNIWNVSFYSNSTNKTDCRKIAEYFGGGGHTGAAGCNVSKLIITDGKILLEE